MFSLIKEYIDFKGQTTTQVISFGSYELCKETLRHILTLDDCKHGIYLIEPTKGS